MHIFNTTGIICFLHLVFCFKFIPHLGAQSLTQRADSSTMKKFCLRSQPSPACKVFAITEFGFSHRLISDERSLSAKRWLWTAEIGAMVNSKTKSAWGATLFCAVDYTDAWWGVRPRYRHWFNRVTSLDLAPGIILNRGDETRLRPPFPNFSSQVCLNFEDLVGLTVQFDIIRSEKGKTRTELYAGVRGGAEIGIIIALILAAAAVGQ
jgi:hypothetical protein